MFLPVPALILFVWLAWMLSNVLPSLGLWGSIGNQFGLTVAAGALVIYLGSTLSLIHISEPTRLRRISDAVFWV